MRQLWGDGTNLLLQAALDAAALRQRVSAHNVANVNTPNFKRQEVVFETALQEALLQAPRQALARTQPGHLRGPAAQEAAPGQVVTVQDASMRSDGNNVDIEREMVRLSMNQLQYNALTQVLNNRYSMLRYVLQEGRR